MDKNMVCCHSWFRFVNLKLGCLAKDVKWVTWALNLAIIARTMDGPLSIMFAFLGDKCL